ncbi:MAG TPA: hypothetical protein VM681_00730 [Candidatus Thermoplasmatota archaeon]|nr:hypothetical protein [Candidatus Thermoplasmatota archaeon]
MPQPALAPPVNPRFVYGTMGAVLVMFLVVAAVVLPMGLVLGFAMWLLLLLSFSAAGAAKGKTEGPRCVECSARLDAGFAFCIQCGAHPLAGGSVPAAEEVPAASRSFP